MKKIILALVLLGLTGFQAAVYAQDRQVLIDRAMQRFTGDWPQIQQRRFVRVLVSYSKTNFFITTGIAQGYEAELMRQYEIFLNEHTPAGAPEMNIVFVPVAFDDLLPALLDGRGDVVAAGLTVTPQRAEVVAFTDPYLPQVEEIIVASPQTAGLNALDDLSGRRVTVMRGSSYAHHLEALNGRFIQQGRPPVVIEAAAKNLASEDILEMVNAGIIDLTVVDRHIAALWSDVLTDMVVRDDLKINQGGQLAWAVRKENPVLLTNLNGFVQENRKGTLIGNILFKRYYRNTKWITNPLSATDRERFDRYIAYFKKYAQMYDFDWLAIAAQCYQESRLDQSVISSSGAIGLMQLLPSTARDMGFDDVSDPEDNIHAGVKYMHYLREKFFNDPAIEADAKFDFTLAGYNAGPNRIARLREEAAARGLDANRWFGNVEHIVLEEVGRQPVRYVSNINKYYVAYRLISEGRQKKLQQKAAVEP